MITPLIRLLKPLLLFALVSLAMRAAVRADAPSVSYIYPAGGQRGTEVEFRVGGHFLYEGCPFEMSGPGVAASPRIDRTKTVWFEGPVIPQPPSQQKEDYPSDYSGRVAIAPDAPLGVRSWRVWTAQGVTPAMKFVVGDLPEVLETELDGDPLPVQVQLPVTINGRIFPREDVDVWTFDARAGETMTCDVAAARIGSPLDSRLEVRDPAGRRIAENIDGFGPDSFVRFTAPVDGKYSVRLHDINFSGLQHYVYRLTITAGPYLDAVYPLGGKRGSQVEFELSGANLPAAVGRLDLESVRQRVLTPFSDAPQYFDPRDALAITTNGFLIPVDDLPEHLEAEPNDDASAAGRFELPAVLNGRISRPGDTDGWTFEAKKGEQIRCEIFASRLGTPLDSVLALLDAAGKTLAESDDIGNGQIDSRLSHVIPADGTYTVRVQDRLASRGTPQFAYRLRVTKPDQPSFRLVLPSDSVNVARGTETKLRVNVERDPGFQEEIELELAGLPAGVTATGTTVGKNNTNVDLVLKADASAKIDVAHLTLLGKSKFGEQAVTRRAELPTMAGEPPRDELALAVTLPTPFKFNAPFASRFGARGSVFVRHFHLDRGGFDGPIEIRLADRQVRHLQGVTGPAVTVPPGEVEFDFAVTLPPWMEIGRTSRTCLMAVGVVQEPDGTEHKVSYSSQEQNDQIIALIDPCRLSVETSQETMRAAADQSVDLRVHIGRGPGLHGPVQIELVAAEHIRGVSAEPITIPAEQSDGVLKIRFGAGDLGPFNLPLSIRAVMADERGLPVTAEAKVTVVDAK